jgi:hypothetical protein
MDTVTQRALDRRAIIDLAVTYAIAIDTRDWNLLSTVFVPGAIAEYRGYGYSEGYEAIEQTCRDAVAGLVSTQHLLGNHLVTFETNDRATSICYVQATHVAPPRGGGSMYTVGGRYDDDLVRTKLGWQFARRTLTIVWSTGDPAITQPTSPSS